MDIKEIWVLVYSGTNGISTSIHSTYESAEDGAMQVAETYHGYYEGEWESADEAISELSDYTDTIEIHNHNLTNLL